MNNNIFIIYYLRPNERKKKANIEKEKERCNVYILMYSVHKHLRYILKRNYKMLAVIKRQWRFMGDVFLA